MGPVSNTRDFGNVTEWIPSPDAVTTLAFVGDTHKWAVDLQDPPDDPNVRQLVSIRGMPGRPHPLGGIIDPFAAVVQKGDLIHEDFGPLGVFGDQFDLVTNGNHDRTPVRDYILARFGSLTWGRKIGRVWLQTMTENYLSPTDNHPPDPAQIAAVQAALLARPAAEQKILMVHRALSGSYPREWIGSDQTYTFGATPYAGTNDPGGVPTDSLTPFLAMLATIPGLIMVVHGHDHYLQRYAGNAINWPGAAALANLKFWSAGSVAQFPATPPFTTTYPEAYLVVRVAEGWYDVAAYRFGYDVNYVWAPDVWEWAEKVVL